MRESWTDDRLDDLSRNMEEHFDKVDERFEGIGEGVRTLRTDIGGEITALRAEIGEEVRALRTEMHDSDRERRTEFTTLQRTMIQVGGGLLAANTSLMAAVIGLMITQL